MISSEIDAKNRRRAFLLSVGIHAAILTLLVFLVVFRPPDPPITASMYGGEVDFGVDDVGSGEVRSLAPANDNPPNPDARAGAPEEAEPQPRAESNPTPPEPVAEEPPLTADDEESPVEMKEPPKIERPILKKTEPKPVPPVATPKPAEEKKAEPEKPKVNPNALFTKKNGAGGLSDGKSDRVAGNNNGDDEGKVGDKGDPRSRMTSSNYSGDPGKGGGTGGGDGGGGFAANVPGWKLDYAPREKDPSDETGQITFTVVVNENGKVLNASIKQSTVSPEVAAFYKNQVYKMKFSRKDMDNADLESTGKGDVKIILKAR